MSEEKIVSTEMLNSLFEEPIPEPTAQVEDDPVVEQQADEPDNIVPFRGGQSDDVFGEPEIEVTPDNIVTALQAVDENGHSAAVIVADISRLHNVTPNMTLEEVPEENREYVDQIVVKNAAFDMYTLDGHLFNVILRFDSAKDAYMKELNEFMHRYRVMQEDIAITGADTVAMFTLTLMPEIMKGQGVMNATFPVGYFRILDDNGVNSSFMFQFYVENIQFMKLEIDDETKSEITADAMREVEQGTGGSLFEN